MATWLTATTDIVEAGRRIIGWSAWAASPTSWRRDLQFPGQLLSWAVRHLFCGPQRSKPQIVRSMCQWLDYVGQYLETVYARVSWLKGGQNDHLVVLRFGRAVDRKGTDTPAPCDELEHSNWEGDYIPVDLSPGAATEWFRRVVDQPDKAPWSGGLLYYWEILYRDIQYDAGEIVRDAYRLIKALARAHRWHVPIKEPKPANGIFSPHDAIIELDACRDFVRSMIDGAKWRAGQALAKGAPATLLKSAVRRGRPPGKWTATRRKFAESRRLNGDSWQGIYDAYAMKYPDDKLASASTIRLACAR